jgi:hypothetical protein
MIERELAELLDKQAIAETLALYCRAMDRIDRALTLSVWHDGGTCNYSSTEGVPDMPIVDYLAGSTKARSSFANHSHQIANTLIRVKGERAVSEAYFTASLQTYPEDGRVTEHLWRGRYLDRWTRRGGRWAIDHRQVVFDSYTPHEFAAELLAGKPLSLGRRDGGDPSYAHLGSLG